MATRPTMDFESVEVEALIRLTREAAIKEETDTKRRVFFQDLTDRLANHKQELHDYRYNINYSRKAR